MERPNALTNNAVGRQCRVIGNGGPWREQCQCLAIPPDEREEKFQIFIQFFGLFLCGRDDEVCLAVRAGGRFLRKCEQGHGQGEAGLLRTKQTGRGRLFRDRWNDRAELVCKMMEDGRDVHNLIYTTKKVLDVRTSRMGLFHAW